MNSAEEQEFQQQEFEAAKEEEYVLSLEENDLEKHMVQLFEVQKDLQKLELRRESIREEIRMLLLCRDDKKYRCELGEAAIIKSSRETLDKDKIKSLIGEIKYSEVCAKKTFDILRIVDKQTLEKMKEGIKNYNTVK